MGVVDAHVHVYDEGFWPARWFDSVAHRWAHQPLERRDPEIVRPRIESGMADPDGSNLIAQMDTAGIDKAVILTLDWELGIGEPSKVSIEQIHERYHNMVELHGDRLVAFAGIDPRRDNAVELLEWAVQRLDMRGLKVYPPAGFYPYDTRLYPLYERCQAWGLPVVIHTGTTIAMLRPRFANPLGVQDVQIDFPKLTIWMAHAGFPWWWDEAVSVAETSASTYLELSNWEEEAYQHEERVIRRIADARDRIGAHRILFGTDHFSGPRYRGEDKLVSWTRWVSGLSERAARYGVEFSDEEVGLILGGNAERCLVLAPKV
ncbi:MAG: amidohydrolase family protein [Streptosporangiales bacterium]|nr:amidohydrolase family protein [Streptosporangiales bacterium]